MIASAKQDFQLIFIASRLYTGVVQHRGCGATIMCRFMLRGVLIQEVFSLFMCLVVAIAQLWLKKCWHLSGIKFCNGHGSHNCVR